eukprot:gene68-biopygen12417
MPQGESNLHSFRIGIPGRGRRSRGRTRAERRSLPRPVRWVCTSPRVAGVLRVARPVADADGDAGGLRAAQLLALGYVCRVALVKRRPSRRRRAGGPDGVGAVNETVFAAAEGAQRGRGGRRGGRGGRSLAARGARGVRWVGHQPERMKVLEVVAADSFHGIGEFAKS